MARPAFKPSSGSGGAVLVTSPPTLVGAIAPSGPAFPAAGPTPTVEHLGALFSGPDTGSGLTASGGEKYLQSSGDLPITPAGDFLFATIVSIDHLVNEGPQRFATAQHSAFQNSVMTGSGSGPRDVFIRINPLNTGSKPGRVTAKISGQTNGTGANANVLASGTTLTGTSTFAVGDVVLFAIQSRNDVIELWSCKLGGTPVLEASAARNVGVQVSVRGMLFGRSTNSDGATVVPVNTPWRWQSFVYASQSLTSEQMQTIMGSGFGDFEAHVAPGNRLAGWTFNGAPSSTPARWGSLTLNRNASWTSPHPAVAPVVENRPSYLRCSNVPKPYMPIAVPFDGSDPDRVWTGTWRGFDLQGVEGRIEAKDGTVVKNWSALTSFSKDAVAGTWQGTMADIPAGGPYRLLLRATNDTSKTFTSRTGFVVAVVVATMGQSPHERFEKYANFSINSPSSYHRTLDAGAEVYMGWASSSQIAGNPACPQAVRLKDKSPSALANNTVAGHTGDSQGQVGPGLIALFNAFHAATGKPIFWLNSAVSGTSSAQWAGLSGQSDATTFQKFQDALDVLGRPSHVLLPWLNGASENSSTAKTNQDALYTKLVQRLVTDRGMEFRQLMLPHQRDYGAADGGFIRKGQIRYVLDHADRLGQGASRVVLGPWWPDAYYNSEYVGTAQGSSASNKITLAEADPGQDSTDRAGSVQITILSGTGAGQTRSLTTPFTLATREATVTPAWTTQPDATSVYKTFLGSAHHSVYANLNFAPRYARAVAHAFGLAAADARGPIPVSATRNAAGTVIDVTFQQSQAGATLKTMAGATNVSGFEVTANTVQPFNSGVSDGLMAITSAVITGANTVRITLASAPANPANLQVRYGHLDPVKTEDFHLAEFGINGFLFDDSGVAPHGGLPAYPTHAENAQASLVPALA